MIEFISVEQVIKIHDRLLKYGGLPGIRDEGLLMSAIEMPMMTMYGDYLHKTMYDKAAAYLFHLIQNHPFNDANKRTGAFSTLTFMELNKMPIVFEVERYENFVVEVAKGSHEKKQIAHFLQYGY